MINPLYKVVHVLCSNKPAACYISSEGHLNHRDVLCFVRLHKISDYTQRNVSSYRGREF